MPDLNVAPATRVAEIVVRLEVDAQTARLLQEAADLAGFKPRVIVTYQGEPLTEAVPIGDAGHLENQRELPPTAAPRAGAALVTGPEVTLPDPDWQQRWEALQARAQRELPKGITPEEIEAEITRAADEVRSERLARGR